MALSRSATDAPAVFVAPHQDDELLSMGAAIKEHVAAGREVVVLLVGRGNKSIVRTRDLPPLLGYTPSEWDFAGVRDAEFRWSVENLGATPLMPSYVERPDERAFTAVGVAAYIRDWVPAGADLKTLTPYADLNPDHVACADAVTQLYAEGWTPFEPRYYGASARLPALVELGLTITREGRHTPVTRADQEPYRFTDLAQQLWGVGYRSVRPLFHAQLADPYAYRVRDSPALN